MICPRCADEKIEVMATSPVKGSGPCISASTVFTPGEIPSRCAAPAANTIRKRSA